VGEPVGEPDTTKRPPDLTAAAGGTEGCCDVTGRVYVSILPWLNSNSARASSSCSLSCSTSTRPCLPSISLTDKALRRMWFKIAALRSRFRPRDLCFAHTAILELPLSTMLVAGCENWGDSREVMRKSRSLRFFFCVQECSPSMSAVARLRFFGLGCGRGRNVRPMAGKGDAPKGNSDENVVGVSETILRC
jgi:hypothetical protein